MAFDFKKEYREFYLPKSKPELVSVPPVRYIAVSGKGDPNVPDGPYQQAISVLYGIAYTLKMSHKTDHQIQGFFEYVVPPLEGFWYQEGSEWMDYRRKEDLCWTSVIRLPDFVSREDFDWAVAQATRKKRLDCSKAQFLTIEEGLCVQCMHLGPYDEEPATIERMNAFLRDQGYAPDLSSARLHHEIYLSDPRKTAPQKQKTVIRHPVRKL